MGSVKSKYLSSFRLGGDIYKNMNMPPIYLVEPYNAYAPKGRKKHWVEILEEQALMERIMAEQIALQEASSKTLPPNSPNISVQTVGNATGGAGGVPVVDFFHPTRDVVNFDRSPITGDAPLTVQFTNLTTTQYLDRYLWDFGDGTTSTEVSPVHVYQTQSSATNVWTASLQASSSVTSAPGGKSPNVYTSASIPTVTAAFTFTTSSKIAPFSFIPVNTTVNTSQTPTTTYLWTFTNGSNVIAPSTSTNPTITVQSGSFTASLQSTGSYNIASKYTQSFFATAPTVTPTFTLTTSSISAPSTASFVNTTTYDGSGTLTYLWIYGSGSLTSTSETPANVIYRNAGPYTASLQVTESLYGIKSSVTRSWRLA